MQPVDRTPSFKLIKTITDDNKISDTDIDSIIEQLSQAADDRAVTKVISLFKKNLTKLEEDIWKDVPTQCSIEQYQNTFRALEKIHQLSSSDQRYNFKIVIPVADRPQHLKQCLDSLLTLCRSYEYGGIKNSHFTKISVLIADDSRDEKNIKSHQKYCAEFTDKGLKTEHFGLDEQIQVINNASPTDRSLASIIPDTADIDDTSEFSHKGASIMRNITYLKLQHDLSNTPALDNTLIYFIDSDQEFCINSPHSNNKYYAINYFHHLNEIFNDQKISVLTGKVVGDPPVSPSVMAGNFQQDIKTFLNTIAGMKPDSQCQFHQQPQSNKDDAAYHDMANLFGFSQNKQEYDFHCTLQDTHSNADCFSDFSERLEQFFYGEHLTRKTFFNIDNGFAETTPARTVYTGNYVIKPEALAYFIPFASLKLRMAGPVLGRLLKSTIQNKFVSANLPMLHNRTVRETGRSEFRPGVNNKNQHIDLGSEFIRQFYGDVMLFTVEKISDSGFPQTPVDQQSLRAILEQIYEDIRNSYVEKHHAILGLRSDIQQLLDDASSWWNDPSCDNHEMAINFFNFDAFLKNIQSNFSENAEAYQQITSPDKAKKHLDTILDAILNYNDDMETWNKS